MKKKKSKRAKVVSKRKDGVNMISRLPNPTLDQANASSRKDKVDMISELPDPILHLILSRLPTTEEVIRTSVLSKRWRHLWTSIPWIDISYFRGPNPLKECECESNKFAEFVYWVLAKKSLDFDSFRLCCSKYYTMSTVGRWIHIAVMNRVKVVDLMFCPKGRFQDTELPHCLVTCGSLEVLKLSLFQRRLGFPKFTGFPALRVLELSCVKLIDADLVQNFLESCPILEDLSLINCIFYKLPYLCISCPKLKKLRIKNQKTDGFLWIGIKICCPKLEFLEFLGHIADSFSIESLDSLKKAVIRPENVDMDEISYDLNDYTIRGLFPQISHAEFLSLSHYFIQELDIPVSLPNLKTLELTTTLDANIMNALIKFLICFPDLESLHLIIQEEYSTNKHWRLGNKKIRRILVPYLKRVEFLEFKGEYSKIVMVRSLLKHAKLLEEVVFRWADLYRDESMETMKEISEFRKASSTVKLITCD